MAIEPYIKKDPNDLIRSGDWNDIQVRARQEIRSHTHKGDGDGTPIPREGIMPNAIDGTRIDPSSRVTVAQLKVVDRDLLADINTLVARANEFAAGINALANRATALENTRVNRAGDTITGALRVNGGLLLGGEGTTLELGAGVANKDPDSGKIAFRAFSQGLDIVGAGPSVAERKISFHVQGGATFFGSVSVSGNLQYSGRLSKLDTDEQGQGWIRAADLLLGHSSRRGARVPGQPLGRVLVDGTDTLFLNYGPDWPKTQINGSDSILLTAAEVNLANQLKVSGGQVRNASGLAMFQTNANDWLRVNMDQSYPGIALYKPVAIGTGGLAVGTWHQMPAGQLRVSDDAWIGGSLTLGGGAIIPRIGNSRSAGIQFPTDPGGGSGDEAFIRYYIVSGETTKLLVGNNNDIDDTVGLWQAGAERLTVYNGNVGIGTTTPQADLHLRQTGTNGIRLEEHGGTGRYLNIFYEGQGTVVFYHQNGMGQYMRQDGIWNRNSDLALKQDVTRLDGMLEKIMALRPVSFRWKSTGTEDIGFVAQDVEKVFPQLVSSVRVTQAGGQELKGLPYDSFGVLAIAALQELKAQYEQRLEALERKLQALAARGA